MATDNYKNDYLGRLREIYRWTLTFVQMDLNKYLSRLK